MNSKLLCALLLSVAVAVVAAASVGTRPGSVPVVSWSNFGAFKGKSEFLDSLNDLDFGTFLAQVAGRPNKQKAKLSPFLSSSADKPEIVVVFGSSSLRTDAFTVAASNGKMPALHSSLTSASSSLIAPYLYRVSDLSETLEALSKAAPLFTLGKSVVSEKAKARETVIDASDIQIVAETISKIVSNGQVDILYVPTNDDAQIATILGLVGPQPFTAVFTSEIGVALAPHPFDSLFAKRDATAAPTYANRWPAYIFQFLLVSAMLLIIIFVGFICLSQIQTPSRYETKKIEHVQ